MWTPESAAEVCGVSAEDIRRAAIRYATVKPAMCLHGLGVTEHIQGTDGVSALAHLALLTGNVGLSGAGVNPLRGQNNVQGSAQMGCEPSRFTPLPLPLMLMLLGLTALYVLVTEIAKKYFYSRMKNAIA